MSHTMMFSSRSLGMAGMVLIVGAGLLSGCGGVPKGPRQTGSMGGGQVVATTAELKSKPPTQVRNRLGPPNMTRREPPAEIWQYTSTQCVIDIVFYPAPPAGSAQAALASTQPSGSLRADWLESRALDGTPMDTDRCLQSLADR